MFEPDDIDAPDIFGDLTVICRVNEDWIRLNFALSSKLVLCHAARHFGGFG
jgi:hypothetical protein